MAVPSFICCPIFLKEPVRSIILVVRWHVLCVAVADKLRAVLISLYCPNNKCCSDAYSCSASFFFPYLWRCQFRSESGVLSAIFAVVLVLSREAPGEEVAVFFLGSLRRGSNGSRWWGMNVLGFSIAIRISPQSSFFFFHVLKRYVLSMCRWGSWLGCHEILKREYHFSIKTSFDVFCANECLIVWNGRSFMRIIASLCILWRRKSYPSCIGINLLCKQKAIMSTLQAACGTFPPRNSTYVSAKMSGGERLCFEWMF